MCLDKDYWTSFLENIKKFKLTSDNLINKSCLVGFLNWKIYNIFNGFQSFYVSCEFGWWRLYSHHLLDFLTISCSRPCRFYLSVRDKKILCICRLICTHSFPDIWICKTNINFKGATKEKYVKLVLECWKYSRIGFQTLP